MRISSDEYQLPEAIADGPKELAELVGVSQNTVNCEIYKSKHNKKTRFIKVVLDEEDL